MGYTNHSGGCPGSDMFWETEGNKYGVKSIAYSYKGHKQHGEYPYIMTTDELYEGWKNVKIAADTLKRPLSRIEFNPYVRNLLCRNWFQIKHSDAVFAIGKFQGKTRTKVNGGTGWAVQMAIDNNKDVYFFDQDNPQWNWFSHVHMSFLKFYGIPILPENFAGIGTRDLTKDGENAIKEIYKHNFEQ